MMLASNREFEVQQVSGKVAEAPGLKGWVLLFGGYFLLQAISRGMVSETLGMDEAQEVLLAQKWSWGYGPQPPLYTWLVLMFAKSFGLSSFTMALLKNVLLFGIYTLTLVCTRLISGDIRTAVVAALALQFMPSIAYEAHRELTQSILASFMVMATLLVLFRITSNLSADAQNNQKRWGSYLLLGILAGLGVLSKYNYAIFYVALVAGAISIRPFRPVILNLRFCVSLGVTLLIVAPNLIWMKTHPELAFASTNKFDFDPTHSFKGMTRGISSWMSTSVDQIGLLVLIFVIIFWRNILARRLLRVSSDYLHLLLRLFVFTAIIVVAGIIISGATNCRNRWLQPLLIPTPMLIAGLVQSWLTPARFKWIVGLAGAVAVGVTVGAPGRILLTETLRKRESLNAPLRQLSKQMQKPLAHASVLYCNDAWLAGNVRIWFPEKIVTAPSASKLYPPGAECAILWDPSINRAKAFAEQAASETGRTTIEAIFFEERLKYHRQKTMTLGLLNSPPVK